MLVSKDSRRVSITRLTWELNSGDGFAVIVVYCFLALWFYSCCGKLKPDNGESDIHKQERAIGSLGKRIKQLELNSVSQERATLDHAELRRDIQESTSNRRLTDVENTLKSAAKVLED